MLPSFLQTTSSTTDATPSTLGRVIAAEFKHKTPPGNAQVYWWPETQSDGPIDVAVLFIPGNPGLAGFYIPFLTELVDTVSPHCNIVALAHSHLGHAPVSNPDKARTYGLLDQVASAVEAFNALKSHCNAQTKVIIIAHSVGCWITTQLMKTRDVHAAFLLTPTICYMRRTRNGKAMHRLFQYPVPSAISYLSNLAGLIPFSLLGILFRLWPSDRLSVLRSLITSPQAVYSTLTMAHEEMIDIVEPDTELLVKERERIWCLFAKDDGWVGANQALLTATLDPVRVVLGSDTLPHAFCIRPEHSTEVAQICVKWLKQCIDA